MDNFFVRVIGNFSQLCYGLFCTTIIRPTFGTPFPYRFDSYFTKWTPSPDGSDTCVKCMQKESRRAVIH